jgi:hypothetical protein
MLRQLWWCFVAALLGPRRAGALQVPGTLQGPWSGAAGLSREQHDVLCFLKDRLSQFYTLDPVPPPLAPGARASCAVVGSSGAQLAHKGQGADIDRHGVIIRFNDAPTKGFEEVVGHCTTFRFGWNTCDERGTCKTESAIHDAPALWPKEFFHSYPEFVRRPHEAALRELFGIPPSLSSGGDDDPTTGFYGMLLALSHCEEVDAYEMAPSDSAGRSKYKYYEEGTVGQALHPPFSLHGFYEAEHDLWARLSVLGEGPRRRAGRTRYPGFRHLSCAGGPAHAPRLPWPREEQENASSARP